MLLKLLKLLVLFLLFLSISCSNDGKSTSLVEAPKIEKLESSANKNINPKVEVGLIKKQTFNKEIFANGKLQARRKVDLKFRFAEKIKEIKVRNGQYVRVGDTIALQDDFERRSKLSQANLKIEESKINLQDILIGQGFDILDSAEIPDMALKTALIKSGYNRALNEKEIAIFELKETVLLTPISGLIANLNLQVFNYVESSDNFCSIIDNRKFIALFQVLESDLPNIKKGMKVDIHPTSNDNSSYEGSIFEINPVIDENGFATIKAEVKNKNGKLIEGMNISIIIRTRVPDQIMIPKKALVNRGGNPVVFTVEKGFAKWNYVKVGLENSDFYIIQEGLKENDTLVISNNLSLAHESRVEVIMAR